MLTSRRAGAAVPQAAHPLADHGRPVVLDRGRAVRHRVPRPAQRAARSPAGSGSCSSCARRLHSTRLARERPLWEVHLIEGLRDGRVAMYIKMHHALVDGVSSMRLLQSVLSTDPDERDMAPMWPTAHVTDVHSRARREARSAPARPRSPLDALRSALGISADAAGLPARAGPDAVAGRAQRDLRGVALRAADDLQQADHRIAPVRRAVLADGADQGDRQGHRHHRQRRGARDVHRRAAHLPRRARTRCRTRRWSRWSRSGCRPSCASADRRRRQRGRRGDVQPRHRPGRPGRPAGGGPRSR